MRSFHVDTGPVQVWGSGFERTMADAGVGHDRVTLQGTGLDDYLLHRAEATRLHSQAYLQSVSGFDRIDVVAGAGQDAARIYDTVGNDSFLAEGFHTRLINSSQTLNTEGFNTVTAFGGGGFDFASVTGTAGDDAVSATAKGVQVTSEPAATLQVRGYDQVMVDTLDGFDSAHLVGDERADLLRSIENGLEYESTVQLLKIVRAENHEFSGGGGADEVVFSQFDQLDLLQAMGDKAVAYLENQQIHVSDFRFLQASTRDGEIGGYEMDAVDFLFHLEGDWRDHGTD